MPVSAENNTPKTRKKAFCHDTQACFGTGAQAPAGNEEAVQVLHTMTGELPLTGGQRRYPGVSAHQAGQHREL